MSYTYATNYRTPWCPPTPGALVCNGYCTTSLRHRFMPTGNLWLSLCLQKVLHTGGGLRGCREGAAMVLPFMATHARKPIDRTKFCHLYWLMGFAAHFVYVVQFDLIRIQSLYQICMCLMNYMFMVPPIFHIHPAP